MRCRCGLRLCKPLLQGASRGLQFKGFTTLPLLGCGSGLGMVTTHPFALAGPQGDMAHHLGHRHIHQAVVASARNTPCNCCRCSSGVGMG